MRVITNATCMADELHVKYNDRQAPKTEGVKSVRKLGSFCRNIGDCQECVSLKGSIGYCQECFSLEGSMCKSMAKELKMRHRNAVPILMLQAGTTVSNSHLADKWHDPETAAGERLEAWGDFTGLSLNPRGVLEARRTELAYIDQKNVWGIVPRERRPDRMAGRL